MRAIVIRSIFLAIILFIPVRLHPQGIGTTTGTLSGEILDDTGAPLANVLISATASGSTKTATTDIAGKFIFPYLTPSHYFVRAELSGFTTMEQQDVWIGLGQRLELTFRMKPSVQESVTVTSESPQIDLTSTTIGANISDQLTERIPIGRSLADIVFLAPGVADGLIGGANFSISGGYGLENTYIVDGAVVTNPGFGAAGSFSGIYGALGDSGLPVNMIQEVQVKTGGFEPEYGEGLGGVINVITRSGGNNLHGDGYIYYTPQSASDKLNRIDYGADTGFDFGGPIIKNKIFFFGAYNLTTSQETHFSLPENPSYLTLPEVSNKTIINSYSMKVTANVTTNHTLEFSASGDPAYRPLSNQDGNGLDTYIDPMMKQSEWRFGTDSQVFRWTGILNSNFFIEAQVARAQHGFKEVPSAESEALPRIVDHTIGGLDIGGFGGHRDFLGNNMQYNFKLTNLWKNHQFRYGVQFEDISFSEVFGRSGPSFLMFNGQLVDGYRVDIENGSDLGFPIKYKVGAILNPDETPTTTKYLDWFVQDSWALNSNLNVTLGVRWEQQRLKGDNENATDVTFSNNWAPRIGATYDYRKNGKSKLFFNYGRYFEKIPNYLGLLFSDSADSDAFYSDPDLTQLIPGTAEINRSEGLQVEGYGKADSSFRTRAQYSNEWIGGIEQEIQPGFSLAVRIIFRNMGRVVDDILLNPNIPCVTSPGGGCVPAAQTVEDWDGTVDPLITNVDGHIPGQPPLVRDYRALEITAEKRLSDRWQLMGSYRYAQLIGNYEGSIANSSLAGNFALSPFTSLNYTKGPLPNDIRHMIKLFGSYQLSHHINTGIAFYFQTGRPITRLGVIDNFVGLRLLTPPGALGRTDSITSVDVHTSYDISVLRNQQITLGLDIFNLFNEHGAIDLDQVAETYAYDEGLEPSPNETFLRPTAFQPPRSVRLLLRYSF